MMRINYPNGMSSSNNGLTSRRKQESNLKNSTSFANRGMTFEEHINQSNEYYLQRNLAVIHKKPTPVQIVKVDYPSRSAAVIKEAYFSQASTTDYNGVYRGYYIDFEAKETKNKTSFPLRNFHDHQISHMKACQEQGGLAFVLLWFSSLKRCFFFSIDDLLAYWQNQETDRKSIPLEDISTKGIEISLGVAPIVPYLNALNDFIIKETQTNGHSKPRA